MDLGWSDGGQGGLRATNADREQVRRLLDIALAEGRLNPVGHADRADATTTAKTRGELAMLVADLPGRRGVTKWIDQARVRGDDRERAAHWLAEGTAQGRLTATEHERRAAILSEVGTYGELRQVLHGLPGWPGANDKDLLAGTVDRVAAMERLAESVRDGRLTPAEVPELKADVGRSRRISDLDRLLARMTARAGDGERHDIARELDAAYQDGRLDIAEHAARVDQLGAASSAELAGLVEDLRGDTRLLAEAERGEMAARLKRALDEGRLDLADYEDRLCAVTAAATVAETTPLFADLVDPPKPAWRGPLDAAFDLVVFNSALLPPPRRRWQRVYPRTAWKVMTSGTVLGWVYLIMQFPAWSGVTVGIGWIPVVLLLVSYTRLAKRAARGVSDREKALVNDIGRAVMRSHPNIEKVEVKRTEDTVTFDVGLKHRGAIPEPVVEETVRLLWCSRLYPLKKIHLSGWSAKEERTVRLTRAERGRLTHRYGPRPYGPLPTENRSGG